MSTNLNKNSSCKIEDKWTARDVEIHFREAILTLKKLPPVKLKGYFNSWPDIVYTPNEKIFQEKKPMRVLATPEAVTKLDQTFEWMSWVTIEERKLIWKRAAKIGWKTICWDLGCNRSTAWRKWSIACTKIASRLNAKQNPWKGLTIQAKLLPSQQTTKSFLSPVISRFKRIFFR